MSSRLDREKLFHDRRFGGDDEDRSRTAKYYSINKIATEYYENLILDLCNEAELLEYGCGTGSRAFYWAKNGAKVTGIDISDEGIKKARNYAKDNGLDISFYQMNAENTQFEANSFDIVAGTGVIHHLNLENAYQELSRIFRSNGHAIFLEPIGHNLIINLYRKLTPSIRTIDEHPLLINDLENAKNYFVEVNVKSFHIFTLLAVPFRNFFFFHPRSISCSISMPG